MGDHNQGAGELQQGLFQHLLGAQVQVVGGLVQDEEVGLCKADDCQLQPGLFPAGKLAYPLEDILPLKAHGPQHIPQRGLVAAGICLPKGIQHRQVSIQMLAPLVVVGGLHPPAPGDAGLWLHRQLAQQAF